MTTGQKRKMIEREGRCGRCKSSENLTIDHIIPSSFVRFLCPGYEDIKSNLQVLCKACNQIKGRDLDNKNPKTAPLVRYFVGLWREKSVFEKKRVKYVFKTIPVRSITPKTTYFEPVCPKKHRHEALKDIYRRQKSLSSI